MLGTKSNAARLAPAIRGVCNRGILRLFTYSFVSSVEARSHLANDGFTFSSDFRKLLLVESGSIARVFLLGFNMLTLSLQLDIGSRNIFVEGFGTLHQIQNAVFRFSDFSLGVVNFVLKCPILLVGLCLETLVPELGNLLLLGLNVALQVPAIPTVCG